MHTLHAIVLSRAITISRSHFFLTLASTSVSCYALNQLSSHYYMAEFQLSWQLPPLLTRAWPTKINAASHENSEASCITYAAYPANAHIPDIANNYGTVFRFKLFRAREELRGWIWVTVWFQNWICNRETRYLTDRPLLWSANKHLQSYCLGTHQRLNLLCGGSHCVSLIMVMRSPSNICK